LAHVEKGRLGCAIFPQARAMKKLAAAKAFGLAKTFFRRPEAGGDLRGKGGQGGRESEFCSGLAAEEGGTSTTGRGSEVRPRLPRNTLVTWGRDGE